MTNPMPKAAPTFAVTNAKNSLNNHDTRSITTGASSRQDADDINLLERNTLGQFAEPGTESQLRQINSIPKYFARLAQLEGWRLWVTTMVLCLGLLLSTLETTIVSTALISISSSLGSYNLSNWIVTAYLLTYAGFLIIFARLSDVFGRKSTLLCALALFTFASLACGSAQSITQLITFRSIQGIGGAGLYSLALTVITEVTPVRHIGISSSLIGSVFAISSILGPILGGAITSTSTWRWIFYLNLPPGITIFVLVILIFPVNVSPLPICSQTLAYIDYPGIILSLAGLILLVFALEQGGAVYDWRSITIIITFIVAGLFFISFALWEWVISYKILASPMLPIFPALLVTRRISGLSMLTAFLTGFPFMVTIVFLPQRFQLENGLSPVDAGIRMLTLLLFSAIGAGLGGTIGSKKNISWHILTISFGLQLLGFGLMSSLPISGDITAPQYVYQVILGLGFGLSLSSLAIVATMEVEAEDTGIAIGAVTQVRVLGGLIGIAMTQAILTKLIRNELYEILGQETLDNLLRSALEIQKMPITQATATRESYGRAFNQQTKLMMCFVAASLLVNLLAYKRQPVSVEDSDRVQNT